MIPERTLAHALLDSMARMTPGGITRERLFHRPHPVKTLLASLPFLALAAFAAFACITR